MNFIKDLMTKWTNFTKKEVFNAQDAIDEIFLEYGLRFELGLLVWAHGPKNLFLAKTYFTGIRMDAILLNGFKKANYSITL